MKNNFIVISIMKRDRKAIVKTWDFKPIHSFARVRVTYMSSSAHVREGPCAAQNL